MAREQFLEEDVEHCVQDIFKSPAGQFVLDWLKAVYVEYYAKPLIESHLPSDKVRDMLIYKQAQADLVTKLVEVYEVGFIKHPTEKEDENE